MGLLAGASGFHVRERLAARLEEYLQALGEARAA
jgi:hypothetical protein